MRHSSARLQRKSSSFLTAKFNSTKALKAKGEVPKYLPHLLKHMRKHSIELFTAHEWGEEHDVLVLWLQTEWPRIFIYPEIDTNEYNNDFSIMYYDQQGGRCVYDTADSLWFAPEVVARQRALVDQYIDRLTS